MATGAYPYQPVARVRPRSPLPIDSPTLLTRRRYGTGSMDGFQKGGTLASQVTGQIKPVPWPGEGAQWPGFPNHPRSNVALFAGGVVGNEGNPNVVRMPIGVGENYLVAIAHRSVYPIPEPAINAGLWARQAKNPSRSPYMQPGRSYALPFQQGFTQANPTWPTGPQWLASRMSGTA